MKNFDKVATVFILLMAICSHHAQAQRPVLLKNTHLIDGTGAPMKEAMSILLAGDSIHAILTSEMPVPLDDFEEVDLTGMYVVPGLVESHTHLASNPERQGLTKTLTNLEILARRGVTALRDMSGDSRVLAYLARQAALGEIMSPDIYYSALFAGPRFFARDRRVAAASRLMEPGRAPWMRSVDESSDIPKVIAEAKGTGATGIKLYANLSGKLAKGLSDEAIRQGLSVWAHAAILPGVPTDMVAAGAEVLSHSMLLSLQELLTPVPDGRPQIDTLLQLPAPRLESLLSDMAEKGIVLDPTITVYRGRYPEALYKNAVLATQMAYQAGVVMVVGTDRPLPTSSDAPLPLVEEMETLVMDVGIPPIVVIQMATLNGASVLGIDGHCGSVEAGKHANLVVLKENPLERMGILHRPEMVFRHGVRIR